jgi:hypothetical protein
MSLDRVLQLKGSINLDKAIHSSHCHFISWLTKMHSLQLTFDAVFISLEKSNIIHLSCTKTTNQCHPPSASTTTSKTAATARKPHAVHQIQNKLQTKRQ